MLELLIQADASPLGIIVRATDSRRLQNQLISMRAKHKRFAALSIKISPTHPDTDVWIIKMDGDL